MDYTRLIFGIILFSIFVWILFRNIHRSGFVHSLLRIDTIAGIVAGVYLVVTSVG